MASVPASQLPLFYKSLQPLSSQVHAGWGMNPQDNVAFTAGSHAIPLTVDEFAIAQRSFAIVFGLGEGAAPLALLGLTDGVNTYLDAAGQWRPDTYLPAFVRRYPFMLAKLGADAPDLSLCFDDSAGIVTADGTDKLFDGDAPSATTQRILDFCGQFEQSVARTRAFMEELDKLALLIDGEVTIQQPGGEPAVFRGFRMIDEQKLHGLRGDQARKLIQSGMLGLVYAHLFSLSHMPAMFERQRAETSAAPTA